VISGGTWLSTSSSGFGNGYVVVNVSQNLTGYQRSGLIDISGQQISVFQPAAATNADPLVYTQFPGVFFPNPTSDKLFITLSGQTKHQILVLDMMGRKVFSTDIYSNSYELDVSGFEKGSYILQVLGDIEGRAVFIVE